MQSSGLANGPRDEKADWSGSNRATGRVMVCLSRVRCKCASWYLALNPCCRQEEFRGRLLGHRVYLNAKAGGENSMPEKRETSEGVYGAVPQGSCDMAKATLPES